MVLVMTVEMEVGLMFMVLGIKEDEEFSDEDVGINHGEERGDDSDDVEGGDGDVGIPPLTAGSSRCPAQ